MKKLVLLVISVITLSVSCSKDKSEPVKPEQPKEIVFDRAYDKFTEYDKNVAHKLFTLWKFVYKNAENKVVGETNSENGAGKKINVVENTVGRDPIYVYFRMGTTFEAKDRVVAEKYRGATVDLSFKRGLYALVKNVGRKDFKQSDLKRLNEEIVKFSKAKLEELMKEEVSKGHFKITSISESPLKIVK